jgi:hypothetical protein
VDGRTIYGHEEPVRVKVDAAVRRAACPASTGTGSKLPRSQLDRWKAVYEAVAGWYRTDGPDAEVVPEVERAVMGYLDPVQAGICSGLFSSYRQILPKRSDETVDLEPPGSLVYDEARNASVAVATQIGLDGPNGRESIRLKTGKRATTAEEAAVLHAGSDGDTAFFDALLVAGSLEEIESDPTTRDDVVAALLEAGTAPVDARARPEPGPHCFSCPRPARCGQYPVAGGGSVGSTTRTVVITKTALRRFPECHRRVGWRRLYAIPDDQYDEEEEAPHGLSVGAAFHRAAAAALLADDPDAVVADAARALPPSERADLETLWEGHRSLAATEQAPVAVVRTEYGIGATVVVPGLDVDSRDRVRRDAPVAVVFVAFADAVGREADGTPAVVEHRTGADGAGYHLEAEVYALGAALLLRADRVAVHTHHLRDPDGASCLRREFGPADLAAARDALREVAAAVAAWHPDDALAPPYTVGRWCTWCEFAGTCSRFRDGAATSRPPA